MNCCLQIHKSFCNISFLSLIKWNLSLNTLFGVKITDTNYIVSNFLTMQYFLEIPPSLESSITLITKTQTLSSKSGAHTSHSNNFSDFCKCFTFLGNNFYALIAIRKVLNLSNTSYDRCDLRTLKTTGILQHPCSLRMKNLTFWYSFSLIYLIEIFLST